MKNIKKYLIILILIFFTKTAFASIEITEIMYDVSGTDTNREWVEVYNNGADPVDLSKWYFFSNNTKHSLNPNSSSSLNSGSYGVIVQDANKFMVDWPSFSGLIFDSSWTGLGNEDDSIAMKDPDLNITSSVGYTSSMGATGDGNSLQKVNGSFVSASPTPGLGNQSSGNNNQENLNTNTPTNNNNTNQQNTTQDSNTSKSSSGSTGSSAKVTPEAPKVITTKIITKNNATTRVGFSITANTIGYKKENLDSGKFVWSFGDGNSMQEAKHKPFEYAYQYSGEYVLTLNYYESILSAKPIAADSITIVVTDPELFITKIGDITDPYVEIKNQSEYKMSLSGWVLNSNNKSFKLPEGMAILPNKSVILSPKVTLFDFNDIQNLSLFAPNGSLVSTYPMKKVSKSPTYIKDYIYTNNQAENNYKLNSASKEEINLNDITANAANSNVSNNYLPLFGLVGVIFLGVLSVIYAHRKSIRDNEGIPVSSSDIRIIE